MVDFTMEAIKEVLTEQGWGLCCRCPLHETRTNVVQLRGRNLVPSSLASSERGTLLIVGEAPGADEDRAGVPFVGASGSLLAARMKAVLDGTGHAGHPIVVVNTVGCRPPDNRTPYREEMAACFPRLELIVERTRPSAVLMLGATAANWLAGIPSVTAWRGVVVETKLLDEDGAEIRGVATWHPAYLLRNQGNDVIAHQFDEDIQLAVRLAVGEDGED